MSALSPRFDWPELADRAVHLVETADGMPLSGKQKRKHVLDELVKSGDAAVKWGSGPVGRIFELLDGFVIRLVLTGLIEGVVAAKRAIARA